MWRADVGKAVDVRHAAWWIDELLICEQVPEAILVQLHAGIVTEMLQRENNIRQAPISADAHKNILRNLIGLCNLNLYLSLWQLSVSSLLSVLHIVILYFTVNANHSFNRSMNAIFGKVGRIASEEVTLQLVKSKCLHILLYGLECYSLLKADLHSLDFVVMRFLMKLFRTANKDIIDECRSFCNFPLPIEVLEIKSNKFCKKIKCNKSMLRYFNISVS